MGAVPELSAAEWTAVVWEGLWWRRPGSVGRRRVMWAGIDMLSQTGEQWRLGQLESLVVAGGTGDDQTALETHQCQQRGGIGRFRGNAACLQGLADAGPPAAEGGGTGRGQFR